MFNVYILKIVNYGFFKVVKMKIDIFDIYIFRR